MPEDNWPGTCGRREGQSSRLARPDVLLLRFVEAHGNTSVPPGLEGRSNRENVERGERQRGCALPEPSCVESGPSGPKGLRTLSGTRRSHVAEQLGSCRLSTAAAAWRASCLEVDAVDGVAGKSALCFLAAGVCELAALLGGGHVAAGLAGDEAHASEDEADGQADEEDCAEVLVAARAVATHGDAYTARAMV